MYPTFWSDSAPGDDRGGGRTIRAHVTPSFGNAELTSSGDPRIPHNMEQLWYARFVKQQQNVQNENTNRRMNIVVICVVHR